jgi:hypothetical protein
LNSNQRFRRYDSVDPTNFPGYQQEYFIAQIRYNVVPIYFSWLQNPTSKKNSKNKKRVKREEWEDRAQKQTEVLIKSQNLDTNSEAFESIQFVASIE